MLEVNEWHRYTSIYLLSFNIQRDSVHSVVHRKSLMVQENDMQMRSRAIELCSKETNKKMRTWFNNKKNSVLKDFLFDRHPVGLLQNWCVCVWIQCLLIPWTWENHYHWKKSTSAMRFLQPPFPVPLSAQLLHRLVPELPLQVEHCLRTGRQQKRI